MLVYTQQEVEVGGLPRVSGQHGLWYETLAPNKTKQKFYELKKLLYYTLFVLYMCMSWIIHGGQRTTLLFYPPCPSPRLNSGCQDLPPQKSTSWGGAMEPWIHG